MTPAKPGTTTILGQYVESGLASPANDKGLDPTMIFQERAPRFIDWCHGHDEGIAQVIHLPTRMLETNLADLLEPHCPGAHREQRAELSHALQHLAHLQPGGVMLLAILTASTSQAGLNLIDLTDATSDGHGAIHDLLAQACVTAPLQQMARTQAGNSPWRRHVPPPRVGQTVNIPIVRPSATPRSETTDRLSLAHI